MSLLIRNGRIITATDDYTADIFIEDEKISLIGKNLDIGAENIIEAENKLIFPGGIDPHVHFDLPFKHTASSDDFETGTRAALFGGTTCVIDFAVQNKNHSLYSALDEWNIKAYNKSYCDYSFHLNMTDATPDAIKEIKDIILREGIPSFKIFMAYKGTMMMDDRQILAVMDEVKKYGGIVSAHATNGDMIDYLVSKYKSEGKLNPLYHYLSQPEISESEATGRFIDLANLTNVKSYVVHITCEGALNKIKEAKVRSQEVFAETCIQYLVLDASLYNKGTDSAKWVISPPLREKKDQYALWSAINNGLIQTVATDHCPFLLKDKITEARDFSLIPNGAPGIENRMELLFSEGVKKNRISLNKYVELTSTNAAKIFGLHPHKGTIAVDSDADIVVFDPEEKHTISVKTHHMNCDYSSYEGFEVTGKCKTVIIRGHIAIDDNQLLINKGFGKFIKRKL